MKRTNHLFVLLLLFVSLTSLAALSSENTRVAQTYTETHPGAGYCVTNNTVTFCLTQSPATWTNTLNNFTFSQYSPPTGVTPTEQIYAELALVIGAIVVGVVILALHLREQSRRAKKPTEEKPKEEKVYCKHCGSKLPRGAEFCIKCGTKQ